MTGCENLTAVSNEAIREALVRVLDSEQFRASRRLQRFLSYIVEKTLDEASQDIKEYNIALAVFDREATFDARTDTIVRVEARRLRQQLTSYYRDAGRADPVVIELPQRGYLPTFRPSVVEVPPVPPSPPMRRLRRYGYPVALAVCGVIIAGLLWRVAGFSYAVPHSWDLDGTRLRILDARERTCWEKRLPQLGAQFAGADADKVIIEDIDGDGRKEVLVNVIPERVGQTAGSLLCFDADGQQRWEFHYGAAKTFAGRSFDHTYLGRFMRPVRVHGKHRLLTVANHYLWYPSQVALLDPATGRVLNEYWHPGSIHHLILRDLDHDGVDEVVFGAINNPGEGLGHAAVGALKLPFAQASPPKGLTGGGEFAYVLFPRPDLNSAAAVFPFIARLSVDQHQRILVQTTTPESGAIIYYLNSGFRVLECRFSDNFRPLHARLANQQLLHHDLTEAELAAYAKVIPFDAAPNGNSISDYH